MGSARENVNVHLTPRASRFQSRGARALLRHDGALGAIVKCPRRVSDVAFSST